MSTDCLAFQDLLSDYFDGRYPPKDPQRLRIEAHLAVCPLCSRELAEYALLSKAVSPGGDRLPDPDAFERRLKARLSPFPRRILRRFPAAAAGIALAAALAWTLRPPAPKPQADTPPPPPSVALRPPPPPNWRLLGEVGATTLKEAAEARDLEALVEDLRLVRGPEADRSSIYREFASLKDLSVHGPSLQEVTYDAP